MGAYGGSGSKKMIVFWEHRYIERVGIKKLIMFQEYEYIGRIRIKTIDHVSGAWVHREDQDKNS